MRIELSESEEKTVSKIKKKLKKKYGKNVKYFYEIHSCEIGHGIILVANINDIDIDKKFTVTQIKYDVTDYGTW